MTDSSYILQALFLEIDGDFEDVSHKRSSVVWQHFLSSKEASKCKYCGRIFRRDKRCSTTNLKTHLKSHHREVYATLPLNSNDLIPIPNTDTTIDN